MKVLRKKDGITLVVLVITIMVLLIILGITINYGLKTVYEVTDDRTGTELSMVQQAVMQQYTLLLTENEDGKIATEISSDISIEDDENRPSSLIGTRIADISTLTSYGFVQYLIDYIDLSDMKYEEYYYFLNESDLEELGIKQNNETGEETAEREYIVNYSTGEVFDIGRSTLQSLARYESKLTDASNCGGNSEIENGNGSLMRMLPVAYYIYYNNIIKDEEIYNIVKEVSSITHAHEISILGCYIYVRYVIELLNGKDRIYAYKNIQNLNYNMFNENTVNKYERILKDNIKNLDEESILSTGYVVRTLEATLWLFLNSNDYNENILKAVNLGDDADTDADCTGGLLGIYYGSENIKASWKQALKKFEYIVDKCNEFDGIFNKKHIDTNDTMC